MSELVILLFFYGLTILHFHQPIPQSRYAFGALIAYSFAFTWLNLSIELKRCLTYILLMATMKTLQFTAAKPIIQLVRLMWTLLQIGLQEDVFHVDVGRTLTSCLFALLYMSVVTFTCFSRKKIRHCLFAKKFKHLKTKTSMLKFCVISIVSSIVHNYIERVMFLNFCRHFVPLWIAIPLQGLFWFKFVSQTSNSRIFSKQSMFFSAFFSSISLFGQIEKGSISVLIVVVWSTILF